MIEVHKFGGASVRDASQISNVVDILATTNGKRVVVVSATGKTTNALEKLLKSYFADDGKKYEHLQEIKENHFEILSQLGLNVEHILSDVSDTFVEIEWIIEEPVQDAYDYVYDQIVSVGELLSSKIVTYAAKKNGLSVVWADVRDMIITDNSYREAKVDFQASSANINRVIAGMHTEADVVVTQGFIGSSTENFTTTLGREGSDYTAAIFSYCLDAEKMTIWKDVPGILTADPRLFENVSKMDRIDYKEAIEMTYFGAKVIHPKTIKPLQNKSIPLYVKPFQNPTEEGTVIMDSVDTVYPPIVVIEANQILLHISTRDFSFVAEEHLSEIFAHLDTLNLKVNMMRNTAISFSVCVKNDETKVEKLVGILTEKYNVVIDKDLELITIRHFNGEAKAALTEGKMIMFEETISNTIRMAVRALPLIQRKA